MAEWSFLTNHARVLLCIARDPGVRLRDIAATLGITERTAFGVVADLTEAGYVLNERDGRRNRYEVQHHLPLAEPTSEATIPAPSTSKKIVKRRNRPERRRLTPEA